MGYLRLCRYGHPFECAPPRHSAPVHVRAVRAAPRSPERTRNTIEWNGLHFAVCARVDVNVFLMAKTANMTACGCHAISLV